MRLLDDDGSEIGEIVRLRAEDGDLFVLKSDHMVDESMRDRMADFWRELVGTRNIKLLLLDGTATISKARAVWRKPRPRPSHGR